MRAQPSFGERLREARRAGGLSQEQLGAPSFSRSYMSLLESGMRPPTPDVISHVAERLGLEEQVVQHWQALDAGNADIAAAVAQAEVLGAFLDHDGSEIAHWAQSLEEMSAGDETGRVGLAWTADYVRLLDLFTAQRFDEARVAADTLAAHWISAGAPALAGRVHGIRARVLRAQGELEEAVTAARAAITSLTPVDGQGRIPGSLLPSWTTLVSALSELGEWDEAEAAARELRALAEAIDSGVECGRAQWVLGTMDYTLGRPEEGRAAHRRAIALIDPDRHLRLWGRLHRSSAAIRLKMNTQLDEVPALLEVARAVTALSATEADRAELAIIEGMYALAQESWAQAEDPLRRGLEIGVDLPPQARAEAHEALGLTLQAIDQATEAREHFQEAVALWAGMGAHARALELCRDYGVTPPRDDDSHPSFLVPESRLSGVH